MESAIAISKSKSSIGSPPESQASGGELSLPVNWPAAGGRLASLLLDASCRGARLCGRTPVCGTLRRLLLGPSAPLSQCAGSGGKRACVSSPRDVP